MVMALHGTATSIGVITLKGYYMAIADFNPDIPQAADKPSQSQGQLLDNFGAIDLIWDINHYTFSEIGNQGKHRFVQMPQQAAKPVISATEMALYTKAVSGAPQLFLERGNNGNEIPMSSGDIAADGSDFASGETWLPSGLLMKFGRTNANAYVGDPTTKVITFTGTPFASHGAAHGLAIQITPLYNGTSNIICYVVGITGNPATAMTINVVRTGSAPATFGFLWQAIGFGV